MRLGEIIGQDAVKQQLVAMVSGDRLSHALLFLSKEGAGALPLALSFAQYMVCEKGGNRPAGPSLFGDAETLVYADDACGVCAGCQKAAALQHPDIHFSYPVVPKKSGDKPVSTDYAVEWRDFVQQQPYGNVYDWLQFIGAENRQGNITATECNEINRKLSLKSFESAYKILVMWMPEYLDNEGNKLLKLIEEPPAGTLFIMVAQDESQILPTILSRTQLIRIPSLSDAEIVNALLMAGIPSTTAQKAAAVAEGNYHEALLIVQHAESDWEDMIRKWLNATLKTGPAEQVKWVAEAAALGREKQKQLLRYFNHLVELSIRLTAMGKEYVHALEHEIDFAERMAKMCTLAQLEAIIRELDLASYHIERNANAKMLFQALTIKMYHIIRNNALAVVH